MRRWRVRSVGALFVWLAIFTTDATAQDDPLLSVAVALESYNSSVNQCHYDQIIGTSLTQADTVLTQNYPNEWEIAKQNAPFALVATQNLGRMRPDFTGQECDIHALAITYGLNNAFLLTGYDPILMEALNRIDSGPSPFSGVEGEGPGQTEQFQEDEAMEFTDCQDYMVNGVYQNGKWCLNSNGVETFVWPDQFHLIRPEEGEDLGQTEQFQEEGSTGARQEAVETVDTFYTDETWTVSTVVVNNEDGPRTCRAQISNDDGLVLSLDSDSYEASITVSHTSWIGADIPAVEVVYNIDGFVSWTMPGFHDEADFRSDMEMRDFYYLIESIRDSNQNFPDRIRDRWVSLSNLDGSLIANFTPDYAAPAMEAFRSCITSQSED